jgi:phosphoribosyl-ATP pyrophosphohydrolase
VTSILNQLETLIAARRSHPKQGSYTNALIDAGLPRMAQKVGEEAVEVVVAALAQDKPRQVSESADLLYHLLVMWSELDVSLADVEAELAQRHKPD